MSGEPTAQASLAEKQSRFPVPPEAGERVGALVQALRPSLPPELSALLDGDTLAVGELGEVHPDVATWPIGADRYVVTFSTGMFVYLQAVGNALGARFIDGGSGPGALEFEKVANLLREAIATYRRQTSLVWSFFHPEFPNIGIQLSPGAARLRDELIEHTARFLLAHEFGHVALGAHIRERSKDLEETDADRFGLEFSLRAALETERQSIAVAAAGLAIRLFVSLERFGVHFTNAYPEMDVRLRTLSEALLPLLGSQQRCDESSRVLAAVLNLMDDLDNAIDPSLPPIPMTVDRLRIDIISRLYELSRQGVTERTFDADLQALLEVVPLEEFVSALTRVCDYYWSWAETAGLYIRDLQERSTYEHGWIIKNSQTLRAAVARLPEAQRALLPAQYRAAGA